MMGGHLGRVRRSLANDVSPGTPGTHGGVAVKAGSRGPFRLRLLFGTALYLLSLTGVANLQGDSARSSGAQRSVSLEDYGLRAESATRWELPRRLREISGLAMTRDHRLLAHNDEAGVVFEIDYRNGSIVKEFQLADMEDPVADDFEGIATADGRIYLVTSSGRLYECREGAAGESVLFRVHTTGVGRDCEIEGLAYDEGARRTLADVQGPAHPGPCGTVGDLSLVNRRRTGEFRFSHRDTGP